MCADRLLAGRRQSAGAYESSFELAVFARTAGCVNVRGVGLNMANNPKKVKDPTEVALSAIQEALNISDTSVDPSRNSMGGELSPPSMPSAAPTYSDSPFDTRGNADRPAFDSIEDPRGPRRAANDDRETIGQILQAIQKNQPARSVYTLASVFGGVWVIGCGLLTVSFLPALQAAIGQSGGVLVLAGLAALFFAPVLLFYFLASLAWRGQEMRMIAQSMAQVAIRFSEPENAASDSMVTVGQAIRREVAAMGDGIERALARAAEYGDGWYGGVFVGAMYAQAFVSTDINTVVENALLTIPGNSNFRRCISDVISWHKQHPSDWKQTWFEIQKKWSSEVGCPDGIFNATFGAAAGWSAMAARSVAAISSCTCSAPAWSPTSRKWTGSSASFSISLVVTATP